MKPKTVHIMVFFAALAVFALSYSGCGKDRQPLALTESNTGSEIKVSVNEIFTVTLEANPSTGFSWHCTIDNREVVELLSDEFIGTYANKPVTGAPGKQQFKFRGTKGGTSTLKFEYYRPWEKGAILGTHVFPVSVN